MILSIVSALAALVAGALGLLVAHAFKTVHRQRIELEQSLERVARQQPRSRRVCGARRARSEEYSRAATDGCG